LQYQKWRFSHKCTRPTGRICRLPAGVGPPAPCPLPATTKHHPLSVEVIGDMVQIAVGSRPLYGLGEDRFITDQVPVGGAGFDDHGGGLRSGSFHMPCRYSDLRGCTCTPAASPAAAAATTPLVRIALPDGWFLLSRRFLRGHGFLLPGRFCLHRW